MYTYMNIYVYIHIHININIYTYTDRTGLMWACLSAAALLCWSASKERDTGAAEVEGAEGAPVCWPHATLGASDNTSDTCCGVCGCGCGCGCVCGCVWVCLCVCVWVYIYIR